MPQRNTLTIGRCSALSAGAGVACVILAIGFHAFMASAGLGHRGHSGKTLAISVIAIFFLLQLSAAVLVFFRAKPPREKSA